MGGKGWRPATVGVSLLAALAAALVPALPAAAATPAHLPAVGHSPAPAGPATPAPHHSIPSPAFHHQPSPEPVPSSSPRPGTGPQPVTHVPHPSSGAPAPRPSPIPSHRPHPEPNHPSRPGPPTASGGDRPAVGDPPAAAWSQAGWLAYVELSDSRDRERNLKEEREALRGYVAEALAQQAELDRQARFSGEEAGQLGTASLAAGFRARILEVQLEALSTASRRLAQPAISLDLIARHPIQLLRSLSEPGAMIQLLRSLSLLSSSPDAQLGGQGMDQRRVALSAAAARLHSDRAQLLEAGSGLAAQSLAAEEESGRRLAESRRLGGSIAQTEDSLAALEARIDQAVQETWAAAAQLRDPEFTALSAGHSTRFRFIWPESNAWISQGFGPSGLTGEPAFRGFAHFHQGVDLAAPANSVVAAADDGVVIMTQTGNYGYGNFVMVAHPGGVVTLYGHLNRILVRTGEQVIQGRPVGLEGSTGYSTGPHLHFEVRVDGEPVDPMPFLPYGAPSSYRR